MKRKNIRPSVGRRLIAALTEVREALATGKAIDAQLTVRTVEISDPGIYTAAAVRKLRNQLGVSQTIFARLMGVSPELVQHWEQGITTPRPIARRLLDQIAVDPSAYLLRSIASSTQAKVA